MVSFLCSRILSLRPASFNTFLKKKLWSMATVERVIEGCSLGEGPHWDVPSQSLYFVDIFANNILKYTPSTKILTKASVEKSPSFIVPVEGRSNEFIVSQESELVIIYWDGESEDVQVVEKVCAVNNSEKKFNDGKCDSLGRLWAGAHIVPTDDFTQAQPLGTLYNLDTNNQLVDQAGEIRVSNGLAFNETTQKLFYIDSLEQRIDKFDLDITKGTISNKQPWFTFHRLSIPGYPDGMTIDTDGNLWVAVFQGSRVLKIDGNKCETLLDTINIPTEQVTSVAFGGSNLDELYVTTGSVDGFGKRETSPPDSGATYKVTGTGAKGLPATNFKLHQ